ncbi:MAG: hypothetical protein IT370_08580 [Deltaproteobacteria bacterium]|nr:hypothetical protein [Deltaproteobacteria bacterium]
MYLRLGLDVGSTTVKTVLSEGASAEPLRVSYRRHRGDPAGALAALCDELPADATLTPVLTGSGAPPLAELLGARAVHEVTALAAALSARHPEARSAVELGGQDAKLLVLEPGRTHMTMNDRCAAGTGVTIDRCLARLGLDVDAVPESLYRPNRLRPISAKCGVFAETDLVNLARTGVGTPELLASLADAIVLGNLAVLARGLTPMAPVILVGGPHVFLPVLAAAWRHRLAEVWRERGVPEGPVLVPAHALHFAALGAIALATDDDAAFSAADLARVLRSAPPSSLHIRLAQPLSPLDAAPAPAPAIAIAASARTSSTSTSTATSAPPTLAIGLDAGSTRTKLCAIDASTGRLLASAQRPAGDPLEDLAALIDDLARALGAPLVTRALGVTGYASPLLAPLLDAEVREIETVAHARAARAVWPACDVVCDVGGQDVKLLALAPEGALRDFRLSTQCSAGIGAALEACARELGVPLADYAREACAATRAPWFEPSCVVFLDAARVTLQRQGFTRGEVLAGLARVLPRVLWTQVAAGTPPAQFGRRFLLQGGVQHNLAAVQAQRDHLLAEVPGAEVRVHPHPSDAGAIGAALAALEQPRAHPRELRAPAGGTRLETSPATRCTACPSHCQRTFVTVPGVGAPLISGHACSVGEAALPPVQRSRNLTRVRRTALPDLMAEECRLLFGPRAHPQPPIGVRRLRIGIPRVLAMYRAAPFFRAYLQGLGVPARDLVLSPPTSDALWRRGARHGSNDPCFPVKVALAHVHHLLARHDAGHRLDAMLMPHFTHALTQVTGTVDSASCPVVAGVPALVRASFGEALAARGIMLLDPVVRITARAEVEVAMHEALAPLTGTSREVSDAAVAAGYQALAEVQARLTELGTQVVDDLDAGRRNAAVVVLLRPYHVDPGLSHRLGEELQALGWAVLTPRSLPRRGRLDVQELSPECVNSGAAERLWAARFAAQHERLGVIDLSSFRCGQDVPLAAPVRELCETTATPLAILHDLDETRPVAALRLRLQTFAHAMRARGLGPTPLALP